MHTPWIASPNWSTACNNVLHQIQRALHFDLLQLRMNNEVLHDITIIRTSLPVYSIQQAAEQQACIFLCRVFKVTFVTSRLEIYLCKPPILQFCFKAHAIVFGGSLHTHVLSILLLKILTLCLSNKTLSFPHNFFRLKKNSDLEYSYVNVYNHKETHLAVKPEAYTSTQTPNL